MVIAQIARELLRQGFRYSKRYITLEEKAFNKLYTGFPQSRTIGRGVRHGLVAGHIVGSFIENAPDTPGNGIPTTFQKPKRFTSRKPYQTRSRFPRRSNRCYPSNKNYREYSRRR